MQKFLRGCDRASTAAAQVRPRRSEVSCRRHNEMWVSTEAAGSPVAGEAALWCMQEWATAVSGCHGLFVCVCGGGSLERAVRCVCLWREGSLGCAVHAVVSVHGSREKGAIQALRHFGGGLFAIGRHR